MNSIKIAKQIRLDALLMAHRARSAHVASALSIADIIAVLYGQILRFDPKQPSSRNRDRFVLSKGHACTALYSVLSQLGAFDRELLETYGQDFSQLMQHVSHRVPGVEFSTGSLGHGLPFGVGKALAAKKQQEKWRTFVLLSDGEIAEGSNWEAMMFASHHQLDNITIIIDYNKLQSLSTVANTLAIEPLASKFESFGCHVASCDGHNHEDLSENLSLSRRNLGKPLIIIADTIKGKGVSFMEDKVEWHYRSPNNLELEQALNEILDA
jgi:transketolase